MILSSLFSCEGEFTTADKFITLEFPIDNQVCQEGNHIPLAGQDQFEIEMRWSAEGDFDSFEFILDENSPIDVPAEAENEFVIRQRFDYNSGPFSWQIIGNSDGIKVPSEEFTFSTPAISEEEAIRIAPRAVTFTEVTVNSENDILTVEWQDEVTDSSVVYDIYYDTSNNVSETVNINGMENQLTKEFSFENESFDGNTTYYILVVAKFRDSGENPNQSFSRTSVCQFCN